MAIEKPASYCEFVQSLDYPNVHRVYHDTQYGFPLNSDNDLFGRLVLEIFQAGLSWDIILKKQQNLKKAFSGFKLEKVANYAPTDIAKLLNNPGIIRNRRKIEAAVNNAQRIRRLQKQCGTFQSWLDSHHPLDLLDWTKLFKKTFVFTGKEITKEFLMSIGYLKGAHLETCPIAKKILNLSPMWTRDGI